MGAGAIAMAAGWFGRKAAWAVAALAAAAFAGGASMGVSERTARASTAPTAAPVIVVGHRGAKRFAPENTLAAYDRAIEMGARVVEMDVRMTADGHFIVMHDARVDRTTDGRGPVARLTLAEIKALDAGSWFAPEFAGERVPTLREALHHVKGRAGVDIDFKAGPEDSAARIAAILDEEGFDDGALVTVFARAWHYEMLKPLPARYALRPHYQSRAATRRARADGVEIMGLRRRNWSFRAARAIADNDIALFANVMGRDDGPKGFDDALRAGARFIQTDRLDLLVPYLEERGLLADCAPARNLSCGAHAPPLRVATGPAAD
jgi:glycerophosphoryl diester phosphodiesterase